MAELTDFPESNQVWRGFETGRGEPDVADLPVHTSERGEHISRWELSWRERFAALIYGRVWLWVWGQHPPVFLKAEKTPFTVVKEES